MRGELKRLQRELGISFIQVTHGQEEAMALADHIVVMNHGKIEQQGSARDIFHHPRTEFVARFIGGHNVLSDAGKLIAVRADQLGIKPVAEGAFGAPALLTQTEYQGSYVAVSLTLDDGTALFSHLPEATFDVHPFRRRAIACWPPGIPPRRNVCNSAVHGLENAQHRGVTEMTETTKTETGVSRRTLLKGTAGLAGLAAGSGAITGFPYVMSAEPKVLRYLGTAVNEGDDIAKQCLKDTGIKIEYITATTDDVTKRVMTQPNSFDVLDTEYFSLKKLVPSGNILALDAKKIKQFDNITPVFTKGETPGGKKIGNQGTAPWKVLYLEGKDSKKFSKTATEFVTLIPTVYNADTLGIRPDLIKRPISSWSELLNPEFKGKASILNIPSIGIMDAAMVVEATGKYKYADKGNMTKEEIDLTMKVMTEAKKAGQFRAFWKDV